MGCIGKDNLDQLRKNLFGILCDKEKNDNKWERTLENVLIEVKGYFDLTNDSSFTKLLSKLSVVKMLNMKYFRRTILDCMNICSRLQDEKGKGI